MFGHYSTLLLSLAQGCASALIFVRMRVRVLSREIFVSMRVRVLSKKIKSPTILSLPLKSTLEQTFKRTISRNSMFLYLFRMKVYDYKKTKKMTRGL